MDEVIAESVRGQVSGEAHGERAGLDPKLGVDLQQRDDGVEKLRVGPVLKVKQHDGERSPDAIQERGEA